MSTRHKTCIVILFIAMTSIFALQCPTNKECQCTYRNLVPTYVRCRIDNNNFVFEISINNDRAYILITCINSADLSHFNLDVLNITFHNISRISNHWMLFEKCNLPKNIKLIDIVRMLGATDIKELVLNSYKNRNLTLEKHNLNGFEHLKSLRIKNYHIHLDNDRLADLKELIILELWNNYIGHLVAESFDFTPKLIELILRNNCLRRIEPTAFDRLTNLKYLHLINNSLTELPSGIFDKLVALENLEVSMNNLSSLPKNIFAKLENLNHLFLKGNNFINLPRDFIQNNTKLITVYLFHNQRNLTLLNGSFSNLTNLEHLDLINNGLVTLPKDLFWRSSSLKEIILSNNFLQSLPVEIFQDLSKLEKLELSSNYLETLPDNIFENTRKLKKLNLSNNRITTISENLFNRLFRLEQLNMERNRLRTISNYSFGFLTNLKIIKLSHNSLTLSKWFFTFNLYSNIEKIYLINNSISEILEDWITNLKKLQTLDLSYNNISTIKDLELHNNKLSRIHPDVLRFWRNSANLTHLTLYENPWECDCDARDFYKFIYSESGIIKMPEDYKVICHRKNTSISEMTWDDFCPSHVTMIISISAVIALIGLIGGIFGLYYKYQEHIKIWLFAHQWCLWCVTEEELDKNKLYDAFVSFSHKDHDFIADELIPNLESGPTPFKLCVHYRDWLAGEWIPDNIARSVDNSRRTIVVLSPNFLKSIWGRMEFRAAHRQALSEGRARVILILYGDIGPRDDLDPELKAYISMNTYVQWGDPWFWDKLRYALPHQSRRPKRNHARREVLEFKL
ncbi:protein toll-like isoform X3 [Linepithema humile]|uniref:protein toll-like isoform X3 n=1 Tax=Linepithema humile TaxID=83485 RepID=UPI00351E8249